MTELQTYQDKERDMDFDYFLKNYDNLFKQYGRCYMAIRNKRVLGTFRTVKEAVNALKPEFPIGSYILQECDGTEEAYTTRIMGVKIDV